MPSKPTDEEAKITLTLNDVRNIGHYLADMCQTNTELTERIIGYLQKDGLGKANILGILRDEYPNITIDDVKIWRQDMLELFVKYLGDNDRTQMLDEGQLRR